MQAHSASQVGEDEAHRPASQFGIVGAGVRFLRRLSNGVAVLGIAVLSLIVLREVIGRYLLGLPSGWTSELSGYLVVGIAYLGAAYALHNDGLIRVTLAIERLPQRPRLVMEAIAALIGAVVMIAIAYLAIEFQQLTVERGLRSNTPLRVPLAWPRAVMAIGLIILALEAVMDAVQRSVAAAKTWRRSGV